MDQAALPEGGCGVTLGTLGRRLERRLESNRDDTLGQDSRSPSVSRRPGMKGRRLECPAGAPRQTPPSPPGSAVLSFTVEGPPVPKARARRGKGGRHYTPAQTRAYESRVRWLAIAAASAAGWRPIADASYALDLVVVFPDARRRDLDNVTKSLCDALNGVAWLDDSQVAELHVRRGIDRASPRVEVTIRRIPHDENGSSALNSIPNRAQVREKQRFTTGYQPVSPSGSSAHRPRRRPASASSRLPTTSGPTRVANARQRGAWARQSTKGPMTHG